MHRTALIVLAAISIALQAPAGEQADFAAYFDDATLRVDFFHVGDARSQSVTIDRLYRQGPWAGPRRLLDTVPTLGAYVVTVADRESGKRLFSRGFDSYFGEYATTAQAADGVARTFHESVLVPFPKKPVQLFLEARSRDGQVRELIRREVDPGDLAISREPPRQGVHMVAAHVAGPHHSCLDLAILGEGYTAREIDQFEADVERFSALLLATEPYASRSDSINIRGVLLPSAQPGCDEPTRGRYRDTSLQAGFNALGSERYLLTEANRVLRDVAANVPYDALVIMVNHDRYGGGGIYNLFCTFTAHNHWSDYLLLHELGHSFSGLADEYYSSAVAYNDFYPSDREPVEPNITALLAPEKLKWRALVSAGTAIPTPWEKAEYDAMDGAYQEKRQALNQRIAEAARSGPGDEVIEKLEADAEALSLAAARQAQSFLSASAFVGQVGAFEGAGYAARGLYRPMLDCIMFSKGVNPYCAVCAAAVATAIDSYRE